MLKAQIIPLRPVKTVRNKFRRGVVVQLRSGGPAMTVEKPGPEKSDCIWFDDIGNEVCVGTFLNDLLIKFVEQPKEPKPVAGQ